MNNNGYIKISGLKGIWTLEEVIELIHSIGFKVKITLSTKEDDRVCGRDESSNLVEKEVR
jgi:hypothetical protein